MGGRNVSTAEILEEFQDEDDSVQLAIADLLEGTDSINDTAGSAGIVKSIDADKINDEVKSMAEASKARFIMYRARLDAIDQRRRQVDAVLEKTFFSDPLNSENLERAKRDEGAIDVDYEVVS